MNGEWLRHPLLTNLTLFGGCVALGIALAQVPAGAQQESEKDPARNAKRAPAAGVQATPAAPRRDTKVEPRDANRAKSRAMTLGAELQPQGDQGLQAAKVEENGIGAKAGLRQQDRIISVDGRAFLSGRQLDAYLASQGGRRVPIVIDRNGRRLTVYVTPTQLGGDTAWLGVFLEEEDGGAKGTRITHVYPSGPAARAGLQEGDIVTQIDDRKVDTPSDLIMFVQESEPQAETQFTILRNDQDMTVPVTLGRREHFTHHPSGNGYGAEGSTFYGQGGQDQNASGNDDFENVPPHAMQLEHDRRVAEQHERIEQELRTLRDEIRQLREELKKR